MSAQELRAARLQKQIATARDVFANHKVMIRGGELQWMLASTRDAADCWFDVAVLHGGYLYVGGDIDCMVFGISSDVGDRRVAWIGRHRSIEYVAEKARIGMTAALDFEQDKAVALAELDECYHDATHPQAKVAFECARETLECDETSVEHVQHWLLTRGEMSTEDFPFPLGHVYSTRLIMAWEALRRAADLICGGNTP